MHIEGNLTAIDSTNSNTAKNTTIAYISCDTTPGFIDASTLVGNVGDAKPQAIILYSVNSAECNLNGTYSFTSMYTMVSSSDSRSLLGALKAGPLSALVSFNGSSNATTEGADGTPGGPPPTTAVAMSILYSITGIITLLFLVVIASGAIRAHRHPERYGPRTGVTGRPRQSRAKGLARAMLETLPIVKFGDPEPVKPGATDIELEDGTSSVNHPAEVTGAVAETEERPEKSAAATTDANSKNEPAKPTEGAEGSAEAAPPAHLGCSICTEDFNTGEDVRVLPCNHKYHPACIDPWLLNVSGTCPLWYVHHSPFPSMATLTPRQSP